MNPAIITLLFGLVLLSGGVAATVHVLAGADFPASRVEVRP